MYTVFPPVTGFGMTWTFKHTVTVIWNFRKDRFFSMRAELPMSGQIGDVFGIPASLYPGQAYMAQSGIISSVLPGVWGEARFLQQVVLQAFIFWMFVNVG